MKHRGTEDTEELEAALGGIGADHIKLGNSNLAGGSPLADLLGVTQVLGRLELEIVEPRAN